MQETTLKIENILKAAQRLKGVAVHTPLEHKLNFSTELGCNVYFKREDLQSVRSYKVRGAFNLMSSLSKAELEQGVVCASAGNHAQGVAYSCQKLACKGTIYMPSTTPQQKINQVRMWGKEWVDIILVGDTFDAAFLEAQKDVKRNNKVFVHPFDDIRVIEGQGTVGVEIFTDFKGEIDYLFVPIGGGGFAAGVAKYIKTVSPHTKIIGVEPAGAPSMKKSLEQGKVCVLDEIDPFVDGAAVLKVGEKTFEICQELLDDVILVPEGKICSTIIKLYNEEAIVVEPAGALAVSALDLYKDKLQGKNVVSVISGGNNDLARMQEIKERSLLYEGLKYYFVVKFPQRAGALKEFVEEILGPDDNIARFEYAKKSARETGPALVGIELKNKADYEPLIQRMKDYHISYSVLNDDPILFEYFV